MLLFLAAVVGGLILMTKAADQFVLGAARLAIALRVSAVVIGAVVVGFGTSAPEMIVSGVASGQGKLDIAVGNIVGSNIANLTLVLGVAGLIAAITVDSVVLRREAPIAAGAAIVFGVFAQNGLARWEGAVLGALLVAGVLYILVDARRSGSAELDAEVEEFLDDDEALSTGREVGRTLLGLIGTVVGAQVLVYGASGIADELGLGEGFIGLTLVALGTSLPELTTAIAAARKREHDLVVGNVLGSNMFNSLGVGGVAALVGPGQVEDATLTGLAVVLMIGISLLTWAAVAYGQRLVRWEAAVLVVAYAATVPLLAT